VQGKITSIQIILNNNKFHGFFYKAAANPDAHFPVHHPLPEGSGKLLLDDVPDDPIPARLEAGLRQQEASQLQFPLEKRKKFPVARSSRLSSPS
jgi:hypothetical protein